MVHACIDPGKNSNFQDQDQCASTAIFTKLSQGKITDMDIL